MGNPNIPQWVYDDKFMSIVKRNWGWQESELVRRALDLDGDDE